MKCIQPCRILEVTLLLHDSFKLKSYTLKDFLSSCPDFAVTLLLFYFCVFGVMFYFSGQNLQGHEGFEDEPVHHSFR